jgi:predicted CDP-diglyceride synthetase/phosphatidate cytidylyltransferase
MADIITTTNTTNENLNMMIVGWWCTVSLVFSRATSQATDNSATLFFKALNAFMALA